MQGDGGSLSAPDGIPQTGDIRPRAADSRAPRFGDTRQQRFAEAIAAASNDPVRDPGSVIAADPDSRALLALARRAARTPTTILLSGPSGSGKEVMARYIHRESACHTGPFVAINCAALPSAMVEALLFGHERGAFTGAQVAARGLIRSADGGTLFLDELGELPLAQQAKLLRVIEQREVLPIGATRPVPVTIRMVAATNRSLADMVEEGTFRADLLWRLSVFPIRLLPLAERPLDILPLAAHLLKRAAGATGHPVPAFTSDALAALEGHGWPGNVRELANCLERATILADHRPVTPADLGLAPPRRKPDLADTVRRSEAEAIARALAECGGRRARAASRLGISERTLRYKLAAIREHPHRPHDAPLGRVLSSMEIQ